VRPPPRSPSELVQPAAARRAQDVDLRTLRPRRSRVESLAGDYTRVRRSIVRTIRAQLLAVTVTLLAAACSSVSSPVASCPPTSECPRCPACPPTRPPTQDARYEAVQWTDIPGWRDAALTPSLRAFLVGCAKLGSASAWAGVCERGRGVSSEDEDAVRAFFELEFAPHRVVSPEQSDQGLVTGYYEPVVPGRLTKGGDFVHPVYGVPDDLIVVDLATVVPELRPLRLRGRLDGRRLVPYYSRGELEERAARSDPAGAPTVAPVLAWVADPVELFFLQIQGSGQLELETGERLRLGYADQNGHPYRSLGRYLVDRGELTLEQASMQSIKAWARANPDKVQEALNANPSYVFFRQLPGGGAGPLGALGVPLTPGYSVAVDPRHLPLGAPVFLATTYPLSEQTLERLMVAQDTGGAIRGAVRADFYWGTGEAAGELAGRMRQRGRMWLLWPRGERLPRAAPGTP
jgi:membrane-bound lytic murein transglycosylase A